MKRVSPAWLLVVGVVCLAASTPFINVTILESGALRGSGTNLFRANSNLLNAAISAQPISSVLSNLTGLSGGAGEIIVGNGSAWVKLPKGTAGQVPTYTAGGLGVSNLPISAITISNLPPEVALDAEVAAIYAQLGTDNTWLGQQTFLGPITTPSLSAGALHATNFTSTTWTNAGSATIGGALTAGSVTAGSTNLHTYISEVLELVRNGAPTNALFGGRLGFRIHDELLTQESAKGDYGTEGVNNGGSVTASATTNQVSGHPGVRIVRTDSADDAPYWGWYRVPTVVAPPVGSAEVLIYESEIRTPDIASGTLANVFNIENGFSSVTAANTNFPSSYVGFMARTNQFGGYNWGFHCISNNVSPGPIDTGIQVTNAAWFRQTIVLTSSAAIGLLNGVPVATNPIASTGLPCGVGLNVILRQARYTTGSAASVDVFLDYQQLSHVR